MRPFVLTLCFALTATGAAAQTKPTTTMQLDGDHCDVAVVIGGASHRFTVAAGALEYDTTSPERSTLALSLDTTSLADPAAQAAFDADHFPELRIASTGVGKKSGGAEALATSVTVGNITRPVVFQVNFRAATAGVINLHAQAVIHSADFRLPGKSGDMILAIDAPFDAVQPTRALP